MIEVTITPKIYTEAEERNKRYHNLFGSSGTHRLNKDRQRMTGYLAEACINAIFPEIEYSLSHDVDFVFMNKTIDSKSQGCNGKPMPHYSATLYEEQKQRDVDYYIFSRIKNDFTVGWICGIISKVKFFQSAVLKPAGTKTNNFTYDESRYELEYAKLGNIYNFINWIKKTEKILK